MATFRKRSGKWHAEISKKGVRLYGSFPTKLKAQEWAAQKEAEIIANNSNLLLPNNHTFASAMARYLDEISTTKKSLKFERIKGKVLMRSSFAHIPLNKINASHIAKWRDERLQQVQPATVNRQLNLISALFSTCQREWKWMNHNPVKDIRRPSNPKPRDRRISHVEIEAILDALGYDDIQPIETKMALVGLYFLIALETAMRLGEICKITNENINLPERYITLHDTKNGDSRQIPLSRRAVFLFEKRLSTELSLTSEQAGALFRKAYKRTDIENLHFHDTRHEALTRLAQKLEVLDLARMIGHRDPRSLMIYYNATATEIASRLD